MKNLFKKLLVVCSLLAPAVYAADWRPYGENGQYDAASLVKKGTVVEVWVRVPGPDNVTQKYSVDCKGNTVQFLAAYETVGAVNRDNTYRYGSTQKLHHIRPNTYGETLKAIVCKPWYWPF